MKQKLQSISIFYFAKLQFRTYNRLSSRNKILFSIIYERSDGNFPPFCILHFAFP